MSQLIKRFEALKITWFDVSLLIAVSMTLAFIRVVNQLPQLYPDEYLYVSALRGENPGQLPNFFYTTLYKPTSMCGDAFYECAKGLNVMFFGVLLVLTFLIARTLLKPSYALLFVGFIGLGPLSGFTTLLTPEILFFVISFAILTLFYYVKPDTVVFWSSQVLLNALLLLTKPHGIFITAGLVGYLLFQGFRSGIFMRHLKLAVTFFLSTYLAVLVIRFILSGNFVLNPLGSRYSGAITRSSETLAGNPAPLDSGYYQPLNLILTFIQQLASHFSIALAVVSVGLFFYLVTTLKHSKDPKELAFVFMFLSLVIGTALFSTVSVYWGEVLQSRIMPRYYEHFLLLAPLFFLRRNLTIQKWHYVIVAGVVTLILFIIDGKFLIFPFDSYFLGIWELLNLPLVVLGLPSLLIGFLLLRYPQSLHKATIVLLTLMLIVFQVNFQMTASRFATKPQSDIDTFELRDFLTAEKNSLFVAGNINEYNKVKFWIPETDNISFRNDESISEDELAVFASQYDVVVIFESVELETDITAERLNQSFRIIE